MIHFQNQDDNVLFFHNPKLVMNPCPPIGKTLPLVIGPKLLGNEKPECYASGDNEVSYALQKLRFSWVLQGVDRFRIGA